LPRTRPEAAGIDPAAVVAFIDAVEQKVGGLHSFMLLRHGQVAAEGWWAPYAPEHPHMLYSLSKSFTSTAVGLAVAEGLLTVDAPVVSFFPDKLPAKVDSNLAAMRVRHLLSMSTGHDTDATDPTMWAPDGDWVKAFLALPVEHEPGTRFVYNSAATYMLSAIVQKLSGMPLLAYLRPRLFAPLGIVGPTWETCPRGINTGGWGLSIKTEDIARFGQLYLQRGEWRGRRLVPESWIAEATSKQVSNGTSPSSDWAQGYGYQFWRSRYGAYRGDGAFGQYCLVMPEQDAVLAITSGVGDMQAVLNAVWEHLRPAMGAEPVPTTSARGELRRMLRGLTVPPPSGQPTSPTASRVSGRAYRFEPNAERIESASLTFREGRGNRCIVELKDVRGEHRIECGGKEWIKGKAPLHDRPSARVAARGAWLDENTYAMRLCFYETPYVQTVTCEFAGDEMRVTRSMNVQFGPAEPRKAITGIRIY
ncbi:MAG TPA: serine hydrolase, partial [Armatimonadota bacterium]|nr:serine hydrolase [Armatimonadota bacterium]